MTPETIILIREAQAGSIEARNKLLLDNFGLVNLALKTARGDYQEDQSLAVEAFFAAVRLFDFDRRIEFCTFAIVCMRRFVWQWKEQHKHRGCVGSVDDQWSNGRSVFGEPFGTEDVAEQADFADAMDGMRRAMTHLPGLWRSILKLRLAGFTLDEVGDYMGLSKERIRQIQGKAVNALADVLNPGHGTIVKAIANRSGREPNKTGVKRGPYRKESA